MGKEMRAPSGACLCLQSIIAAESREEEASLLQTDMRLPKTHSLIRLNPHITLSPTCHTIMSVTSAVGEASTCRRACVCMTMQVCMSLRSTVSHAGSQAEATDQVM